MSSKDLLARTAQYHVREPSPRATSPESLDRTGRATTPNITSREPNENRPPSRRTSDAADRIIPPAISDNLDLYAFLGGPTDVRDYIASPPLTIRSPTPLFFTVTTDCSDHSHDEEEESSPAILADRFRRDHIPSISTDSSSDSTDDGDLSRFVNVRARRDARPRRNRRRSIPSRIEITAPNTAEELRNVSNANSPIDVLAPHAKFFIE